MPFRPAVSRQARGDRQMIARFSPLELSSTLAQSRGIGSTEGSGQNCTSSTSSHPPRAIFGIEADDVRAIVTVDHHEIEGTRRLVLDRADVIGRHVIAMPFGCRSRMIQRDQAKVCS